MSRQPSQAFQYQQAAFHWLDLARKTDDLSARPHYLAVARAWLEMAHEAFEQERQGQTRH